MQVTLVYTPEEIHPDVLQWATEGWPGKPEDAIPFLKHLAALRQSISRKCDHVIIVERGVVLDPDFKKKIYPILSKIPDTSTTCLLSHYVTSWQGLAFIDNTDKQLCTVNINVHGSFAYWMRRTHIEHLLAIYDQPLRNIAKIDLTPDKVTHLIGKVCMVYTPLAARLDTPNYKAYFANYGFLEKA